MEFKLVVCLNYNNSIGSRINNDLIFNIPQELKHFKKLTTESRENMINVLIMGKHTWNSIPKKPLQNRMNFIISSEYETINYEYRDHHTVIAFPNNETCLSYIEDNKMIFDTIFIIGGISIYEYYLNHNVVTQIICTKIKTENNDGDIFFNPNYFNFFLLGQYESFNNIQCYNNISNTNMMINYSICNYLKISNINPNLIYNKSLYCSFTDSEGSSCASDTIDNDKEIKNTTQSIVCQKENAFELDSNQDDSDSYSFNCELDLDQNSLNEYDNSYKDAHAETISKNSFYISDSETDNENDKGKSINYNYSVSSLESIQVNNELINERDIKTNDNIENELCKTIEENDSDCGKNEWTLINNDEVFVRKHNLEYKMQYLKYYYSMLNKDKKTNENPINMYNDNSSFENKTFHF